MYGSEEEYNAAMNAQADDEARMQDEQDASAYVEMEANQQEVKEMELLSFDEWFNKEKQMDLRMPMTCILTFKDKLTIQEWQEFIKYIYTKCIEARSY